MEDESISKRLSQRLQGDLQKTNESTGSSKNSSIDFKSPIAGSLTKRNPDAEVPLKSKRKRLQTSTDMKDHKAIIVTDADSSRKFITTKQLLKSLYGRLPLYINTTFKLMRKPVTVCGSDSNGHFNPIGLAVTNGEELEDFLFLFESIKDNISDCKPEHLFCIATSAIRTAAVNVFGDETIICTSSSRFNDMEALFRTIKGLDSDQMLIECVTHWSQQQQFIF